MKLKVWYANRIIFLNLKELAKVKPVYSLYLIETLARHTNCVLIKNGLTRTRPDLEITPGSAVLDALEILTKMPEEDGKK